MTTKQQTEALHYFRQFAEDWQRKADAKAGQRVNVIQQRNDYALEVVDQRPATRSLLDIGCGTGELVCAAARRGVAATGVDFAEEMIAIAEDKARAEGLANARFVCASIFAFPLEAAQYDVMTANGLIEYISLEELDQLLALNFRALAPQGSLVMGSRNRLFNLFSLNSFTRAELDGGSAVRLLEEALALASGEPLGALLDREPAPLQPAEPRQANTGINVSTRYQYTPVQLMQRLRRAGFEIRALSAIHIHGVPPAFKHEQPAVHTSIANLLQPYAGTARALLPFASSFMLHAVKA